MTYLLKLSAAAIALLPSPLLAETTDKAEIVVTATGVESDSGSVGQAITRIDSEAVERRGFSTIDELLATTPGVTVTQTGPIGGFSAVRIRGAEGEQTLALIDGVRINDPAAPGGGFDFANLLTGNIDSVEILRGANSVPWGSQAIGGIVNITTRRPDEGISGRGRIEYGTNDRFTLAGNASYGSGAFRASLGGGYFNDDGISAAASGSEADGYRQYAANGRVEVDLSDSITIDLRGYFADGRADLDGFPPPFYSLSDTAEYSTAQQLAGYAGLKLSTGPVKHVLAFTINDIDRDNFASPTAVAPDFFSRGRRERFEYKGDWEVAAGLRAVFGAEHERSRFFDGFLTAKADVSGGYVQLVAEPFEALTLTGGARIDDHKTYGSKATFSANAAWRVGDDAVLRAAYAEGFKAPTLYQLFSFYGDPDLQPEEAKSYEIGAEQWLLNRRVRVALTGWQRRTRHQIDFDLSSYLYNNIARSRGKGIEAELELRPSERMTLSANYSYTDSEGRQENVATYSRLLRRPVHSLNVAVDWNAFDRIKLGAALRMVGDSRDGFGGSIRLDGFALATIRAAVPVTKNLELYGRVENLFDADYQTVAGYNAYGRNAHFGLRAKF
ncbi:MAG: TonB-dependent receptor [Sphingomonadales bacterium]|jgi:vitamin B12 transporter|nr:TonB-dependent receptor [Sphingomonadales bacterium]MBK9003103.1 TonB-dependent receptor [Sphingomonadales bacterium]MBK9268351.1 TonB-dependent receptor [Sphingomonadales bacterium]MBP6435164.1 TonB-dependent receptor [Sphingorhabdus sp.]